MDIPSAPLPECLYKRTS